MKKYWYCVVNHHASVSHATEMHLYNTKAEAEAKRKELYAKYRGNQHYTVYCDWQWANETIETLTRDTSIITDHR
jgi:hypothetical protein